MTNNSDRLTKLEAAVAHVAERIDAHAQSEERVFEEIKTEMRLIKNSLEKKVGWEVFALALAIVSGCLSWLFIQQSDVSKNQAVLEAKIEALPQSTVQLLRQTIEFKPQ